MKHTEQTLSPSWAVFVGRCAHLRTPAEAWHCSCESIQFGRRVATVFRRQSQRATRCRLLFIWVFGSAGNLSCTVVGCLRFLGVRAAGTYIALFGGFAASIALVISAFSAWVLSVPEVAISLVATRVLRFMTLLFGGVSFAVGKGLARRICFMQLPFVYVGFNRNIQLLALLESDGPAIHVGEGVLNPDFAKQFVRSRDRNLDSFGFFG
jgi:hypothetical protein